MKLRSLDRRPTSYCFDRGEVGLPCAPAKQNERFFFVKKSRKYKQLVVPGAGYVQDLRRVNVSESACAVMEQNKYFSCFFLKN